MNYCTKHRQIYSEYCVYCGKPNTADTPLIPIPVQPYTVPEIVYKKYKQPCLWDSMPETPPGSGTKIGLLNCNCPRCRAMYTIT